MRVVALVVTVPLLAVMIEVVPVLLLQMKVALLMLDAGLVEWHQRHGLQDGWHYCRRGD